MVPERDVDPADLYHQVRLGFVARLRPLSAEQLSTRVPATPRWSVHDVLAHVVGITADLNAQRFGDGDGDAWTRTQVGARRDRSIDELATEWDEEAPTFEAGLRLFGYGFGAHYLGDLLQHVGDVETALGRPPARNDLVLAVALDFYLESLEESLVEAGIGALAVHVADDGESWTLGRGPVVASVRGPRYELFRSLGGRRTRDEIAGLDWSGDSERLIGLVSRYPVPDASLHEPALASGPGSSGPTWR